jgi:hypothetical protein
MLDIDGGAVAIGARVRYVFSGGLPIALLGEAYFAPEVTSLSEFDGVVEYRLAAEFEITPSARAYLGYRLLEVTFNNNHGRASMLAVGLPAPELHHQTN